MRLAGLTLIFLLPFFLFSQEKKKSSNVGYLLEFHSETQEKLNPPQEMERARDYLQFEKEKKAIRLAKKMQKKFPGLSNWYFIRIVANDRLGNTRKVEKLFEAAFENLPPSALLYYNYGIKKLKMGEFAHADQFFQQSIQLEPAFPESHLALSKTQELQGNRIKAILPLYLYFLFLADGEENEDVLKKLKSLLFSGIEVVQESGLTFSLPFSKEDQDQEILKMELIINELNSTFKNQDYNPNSKLLVLTERVFTHLQAQQGVKQDIWWSFYANILGGIAENNHTSAYLSVELENNNQKDELQLREIIEYLEWKENL